jgi:hypothetical protein
MIPTTTSSSSSQSTKAITTPIIHKRTLVSHLRKIMIITPNNHPHQFFWARIVVVVGTSGKSAVVGSVLSRSSSCVAIHDSLSVLLTSTPAGQKRSSQGTIIQEFRSGHTLITLVSWSQSRYLFPRRSYCENAVYSDVTASGRMEYYHCKMNRGRFWLLCEWVGGAGCGMRDERWHFVGKVYRYVPGTGDW